MPYKHQMEVAHAASSLREKGIPIEVSFIGASWGDYGPKFRRLLYKLDPKREFLLWSGSEPFERLHEYYQDADAFVFASSCENLPNILIEAMASGLPIACSNRGPMPEVLGDAGIYFDPDIPDSIAKALHQLIVDSSLRASLSEQALIRANGYSWTRCASETFKFLAEVAKKHK